VAPEGRDDLQVRGIPVALAAPAHGAVRLARCGRDAERGGPILGEERSRVAAVDAQDVLELRALQRLLVVRRPALRARVARAAVEAPREYREDGHRARREDRAVPGPENR